jgi:DNA-directed RNA polymerase subunit RPC12/RpoP
MTALEDILEKINQIELRLATLERQSNQTKSKAICKRCGSSNLEFVSSEKHQHLGIFGDTTDTYKCSNCGLELEKHVKNR